MANFTEMAIMGTFEKMLTDMPFDKITVTALSKRCGISPNTFYYHFEDIYDLLLRWLHEKRLLYDKACEALPGWADRLKLLLTTMRNHKQLIYHLTNSLSREQTEHFLFTNAMDIFTNWLREMSRDCKASDEKIRVTAEFCCYCTLGFFLSFLWKDMQVDIDQEVDRFYRQFEGTINYMLRQK